MSLTLDKRRRLLGKGFDRLYTDHEDKWREMVDNAVNYAKTYIKGDDKVHPGDIVELLESSLRLDPNFTAHVLRLPQQYWINWFAEYILEMRYPPPDLG